MAGAHDSPVGGLKKRKAPGQPKFYAVRAGHTPGVYATWDDCRQSITGFKGSSFKTFPTFSEAEAFVAGHEVALSNLSPAETPRFYGIASGHNPGIYTNWADAQEQIKGWKNPKYKKFATREEAEAFVQAGRSAKKSRISLKEEEVVDKDILEADEEPPLKRVKNSSSKSLHTAREDNVTVDSDTVPLQTKVVALDSEQYVENTNSGPLRIYTDGSSLGNGKVGAVAGVGVFFGKGDPRNVSEPLGGELQTNQRAELTAILRALEIAPVKREVHIFTDSSYSINCVTIWFKNWERNKWMTSLKQPVLNKDLIQEILVKIRERQEVRSPTVFNWIKGHSSDPGNEAADRLAVSGAQRSQQTRRA